VSYTRRVLQGSASNVARLLFSMLVGVFIPPFLVRHLSQAQYGAWTLILQLSAYINLLDLGLQTAVSKFVAEYHAIGDRDANHRLVSTSLTAFILTAPIGAVAVIVMTFSVPGLFHQMPADLLRDVRFSLLVVGLSAVFALPFNPFLAVFNGLQDYSFPTVLSVVSRALSAFVLVVLLLLHGGLIELAFGIAFCNIATALTQFHGWRRFARERVAFSFPFFDRKSAVKLGRYSGVLIVWTLGGLCVSGLDLVLVGHFDYRNTGFYAIGASLTNFMLLIVSSLFGPLMPAISSMQAEKTPRQIGDLAIRATRYGTLLLCLLGLPLLIGAYPLLTLWVGTQYALGSVLFLQVLIIANMIRQLAYPYSLIVVATGKQHVAMAAAISEAVVNIVVSMWLAYKIGAIGVAIGTIAGALVSLGLHIAVSMYLTRATVSFERSRLVLDGILRPLSCTLPSLLLIPFLRRNQMVPARPALLMGWLLLTAGMLWLIGLEAIERQQLRMLLLRRSLHIPG
jgi:O-antigen/teichoic acid export membrane protein